MPGADEAGRQRLLDALREHNPATPQTEPHLAAVLADTTAGAGRLLRARLVHTGALRCGLEDGEAAQLACALEYYHAASLLLDDLPCMDNATLRRGRPCAHRLHGEATAILAALALINRAYALAQSAFMRQPHEVRLGAAAALDGLLGPAGLTGGQARDLRFAESARTAREVAAVALGKTGGLLRLCLCLPALPAGPGAAEWQALKALGIYWGLAYQIADDFADTAGAAVSGGKTAERDRVLRRPNLILALGHDAARQRLARLLRQADRTIARLVAMHARWDFLHDFQQSLLAGPVHGVIRPVSGLAA